MSEEAINIVGIIQPNSMEGTVTLDDAHQVISSGLRLNCYLPTFNQVIKKLTKEISGIDIQTIFQALDHIDFVKNICDVADGRDSITNIQIIKSALYLYIKRKLTIDDLHKGITAFMVADQANMQNGVRLKTHTLVKMLRSINKFILPNIVDIWIQHCLPLLKENDYIQPYEFLFLLCNSIDRRQAIQQKLPKTNYSIRQDPIVIYMQTKTYVYDQGLSHNRAPDYWLSKIIELGVDYSKIHFESDIKVRKRTKKQDDQRSGNQSFNFKSH